MDKTDLILFLDFKVWYPLTCFIRKWVLNKRCSVCGGYAHYEWLNLCDKHFNERTNGEKERRALLERIENEDYELLL